MGLANASIITQRLDFGSKKLDALMQQPVNTRSVRWSQCASRGSVY